MTLRGLGFVIAAGLMFSLPVRAATPADEMAAIKSAIARQGPKIALEKFFSCDRSSDWSLIESGDPRAIRIAFALRPALDGCYGEIMNVSLGKAMSNNPHLLLSYYDKYPIEMAEWCVPGLFEPKASEWRAALDKAEKAFRRVRDPKLLEARDICLGKVLLYKSRQKR